MAKHLADKSKSSHAARLRDYLAHDRAGQPARASLALLARPRDKSTANRLSQFARIARGRTV